MDQDWKAKYFDSLDRGEQTEKQLAEMEKLLRLTVSRLSAAADGIDQELDQQLDRLRDQVRSQPTSVVIESLLEKIGQCVSKIDRRAQPEASTEQVPASLAQVVRSKVQPAEQRLLALLDLLGDSISSQTQAEELRRRLAGSLTESQWGDVLSQLADLVSESARAIRKQLDELNQFLRRMTGRLKAIDQSLSGTSDHMAETLKRSEVLVHSVGNELGELKSNAHSADNLADLKNLLELRAEQIQQRLHEFVDDERQRHVKQSEELNQLRARVTEMEHSSTVMQDELREAQRMATRDQLTGLHNRRAYDQMVEAALIRCRSEKTPLSLVVGDIDRFKKLNDSMGHAAGDKVLKSVAEVLLASVRQGDLVARYGGEEFVIMLTGSDEKSAARVAATARQKVEAATFSYRGKEVAVTMSFGFATLQQNDSALTLFQRADQHLYSAKDAGRNAVCGDGQPAGAGLKRTG